MSKLARAGTADLERFDVLSSRLPFRDAQGLFRLDFGDIFALTSFMNFVVENAAGEVVLMIFQSSSGACSLRVAEELPTLTAFAIAIAAVAGK
jgi:hypothetical protein